MGSTEVKSALAGQGYTLKDESLFDYRGLVAGKWTEGKAGKTFPVYEPSSGTVLHECADLAQEDFVAAIDDAYKGYMEYYDGTSAKERGAILKRWNDLILENIDDGEP